MGNRMEVPDVIKKDVEKKGGIGGIASLLAVEEKITQESKIHHALSEPLRMKILNILIIQPLCVCLMKEIVKIPDSKLSYHLSALKECGLIEGKRKGNWIIYHATESGKKYKI